MKLSLERKIFLGFSAALLVLVLAGWIALRNVARVNTTFRLVDRAHRVLGQLEQLLVDVLSLPTSARGFVLTGEQAMLAAYEKSDSRIEESLRRLRELTAGEPESQKLLARVEPLVADARAIMRERMVAYRAGGLALAADTALFTRGVQTVGRLRSAVEEMERAESRRVNERFASSERASRAATTTLTILSILATGFVAVAGLVVHRDFRRRRQTEAALEHERHLLAELMDKSRERIYFKDRASRFLRVNRGVLDTLGATDPAQVVGRTDADFFSAEHASQALADEQEIMRTGRSLTREEKETWPDGRVGWALTAKLPLRDASGAIVGTFGLTRDITERRRAEDALRLAKTQLEAQAAQLAATNADLESFSSSVSHDLRAPLRHVSGFAGMLERHTDGALDDTGRRYIGAIRDAAKQMGRLVDDLLAFSRNGRTALATAELDHDALVAEVLRSGRYDADGRKIVWEISPLPRVVADATLLRQVWANLIDNAVKYSRDAAPARISISCQPADLACREHIFCVRDNGAGFDPAFADKLFGVFQRLHSADQFEGTGIGLANVRRIVTRHGGRTWAEGAVGRGAAFFFSLPDTAPI